MGIKKILISLCCLTLATLATAYVECNVLNYGAVADNTTDLGPALTKAWNECVIPQATTTATDTLLYVPSGNFLLASTVTFDNAQNWNLHITGNIYLPFNPNLSGTMLTFENCQNILLDGPGAIYGNGYRYRPGGDGFLAERITCKWTAGCNVGSFGSGATGVSVQNVVYRDVTISNSDAGVEFKSYPNCAGTVRNISEGNGVDTGTLSITDVLFENFQGTGTPNRSAVTLDCNKATPCQNIMHPKKGLVTTGTARKQIKQTDDHDPHILHTLPPLHPLHSFSFLYRKNMVRIVALSLLALTAFASAQPGSEASSGLADATSAAESAATSAASSEGSGLKSTIISIATSVGASVAESLASSELNNLTASTTGTASNTGATNATTTPAPSSGSNSTSSSGSGIGLLRIGPVRRLPSEAMLGCLR
ncbi:hypothetical protein Clacol_009705 [Clathrus columnatus]|uniref:Rhamnogalacturonase A/B/Epimerase-like pectate lyase domain-containing protein n=1 Tax=Clathrus columnatus TaxID=1419009 RepID=A0AAV5AQW7_9AGAM|nr:hypothetical protein Clacol_009705 [Clathrus columnatus]